MMPVAVHTAQCAGVGVDHVPLHWRHRQGPLVSVHLDEHATGILMANQWVEPHAFDDGPVH